MIPPPELSYGRPVGREIRPAGIGDAEGIATVHVAAWRAAYRGIVPDAELDGLSVAERAGWWAGLLAEPAGDGFTLVAVSGEAVDGFCSIAAPSRDADREPGEAEVAALYVDPAGWRGGTGRTLLEHAAGRLAAGPWRTLGLWVYRDNAAGRAFYRALGFRADGTLASDDGGAPEVRLRRDLVLAPRDRA